jgi:hypothetical protein
VVVAIQSLLVLESRAKKREALMDVVLARPLSADRNWRRVYGASKTNTALKSKANLHTCVS